MTNSNAANIRPPRVALDLILITGTAECLVALTVSDNAAVPVSASATGAVVRRRTRAPRGQLMLPDVRTGCHRVSREP